MNITFKGTNLELHDDIRTYVEEKLHDCFQAFGDLNREAVRVAIELERTTRHHRKSEEIYRVEANVSVPGRLIRVEETGDDFYRAVVEMKETLTREIRHWRERTIDKRRKGARAAKALLRDMEE